MSERPAPLSLLSAGPLRAAIVATVGHDRALHVDLMTNLGSAGPNVLRYSAAVLDLDPAEAIAAFELYLTGRLAGVPEASISNLSTLTEAKRC